MAMPGIPGGSYIPTTQVWDVTELYATDVTKPEFKELLVRMYQQFNGMAQGINSRDAGQYHTDEFVNGQTFFPDPTLNSTTAKSPTPRQVFRKVINFGVLPNTATKTVAHGIPIKAGWTFTRIYGTASNIIGNVFIPLPYSVATLNENIELWVDATNINIKTAIDFSAYTVTYIILEYLKS